MPRTLHDDDIEILLLCRTFRTLRSRRHIARVLGETGRKRAYNLVKEGYLIWINKETWEGNRRTEAQLGISEQGARLLHGAYKVPLPKTRWRDYHQRRFETGHDKHDLFIADILFPIIKETRDNPHIRFIHEREIFERAPGSIKAQYFSVFRRKSEGDPRAISQNLYYNNRPYYNLKIFPDYIFGLEIEREGETHEKYFMLEADRGTEDISAKHLRKASITKKLIAYEEAGIAHDVLGGQKRSIIEDTFGIKAYPWFVTTGRRKRDRGSVRKQNMIKTQQELSRFKGNRRILFSDENFLYEASKLNAPITNGRGESTSLVDISGGLTLKAGED